MKYFTGKLLCFVLFFLPFSALAFATALPSSPADDPSVCKWAFSVNFPSTTMAPDPYKRVAYTVHFVGQPFEVLNNGWDPSVGGELHIADCSQIKTNPKVPMHFETLYKEHPPKPPFMGDPVPFKDISTIYLSHVKCAFSVGGPTAGTTTSAYMQILDNAGVTITSGKIDGGGHAQCSEDDHLCCRLDVCIIRLDSEVPQSYCTSL